jgi:hypothetical protein
MKKEIKRLITLKKAYNILKKTKRKLYKPIKIIYKTSYKVFSLTVIEKFFLA